MFKRNRFQHGSLSTEKRSSGDVWIFRWRETNAQGVRVNRKLTVGSVTALPTKSAAAKAVAGIKVGINEDKCFHSPQVLTVGQAIAHYREHELQEESVTKAYSTRAAYSSYLTNWILPRWEHQALQNVKTIAVERWLSELELTKGSKAKIRNIMSALFNHAMRHEWVERNPISLVRQSAKRERIPDVLTPEEIRAILNAVTEPCRTMIFLAAATGLRVSELLALQWGDIDFDELEINLSRAIVHQVIGELKTEASKKPVPLDPDLAAALEAERMRSKYNGDDDWVFASPEMNGEQPYWPENILRRYIRPAAKAAGVNKTIGWHTFRHTYATLLKANGEDVKVVQESLRHANSRITLDTYIQATTPAKREAQSRVVQMIAPLSAISAAGGAA